jgi:drug/metabolite transporter (DMT)-like permease
MMLGGMQTRRNAGMGQLAIALCAVFWSTSGLFIKLLDMHPIVIAGGRSLIAAVFMLTLRRIFPQQKSSRKDLFNIVAAAVAYSGTMITFVIANKLTASANVILLQYSAPIWACLLGWVLIKEKPRWEHWTALGLIIAGMVIFFSEALEQGSIFGDGLAVFSGVLFGANSVFMRAQKEGNPADSMLLSHIITALFAIPFFFLFPPSFSLVNVGILSFMGVVQIGCASLLFAYGIRRIPAVQAMLTASIEPILSPVWVLLVTGEKPTVSALLGGFIIIFAVVFSSVVGKQR